MITKMSREELFNLSDTRYKRAKEIIEELKLIETWEETGATINTVGSVRTNLLMKHRDIDFHIYSEEFDIKESFAAIAKISDNNRVKRVQYGNLIEAEDRCLEWHLFYEAEKGEEWQIDLIHILNDSPYKGYFEKVADRINDVMDDEKREAILRIKNDIPEGKKVMGINIYKAVIKDGVRDYSRFLDWEEDNGENGIVEWMP